MYKMPARLLLFPLNLQQLGAQVKAIRDPKSSIENTIQYHTNKGIEYHVYAVMVQTTELEALKRQSEDGDTKEREENYRRGKEQETTETAAIIEEIIEGISLQNRRGTIVRTISAIIR